ncbi:late competence development ComFB family protein [Clostridium sp.]|uniref:late competence development ComFB family protein n=1 Tax=Clostridium sp. TaxID=1506 RepID=UPI002627AAFE|nr:late competence development ComFB family protein [Clostridium sp.]
MLKNYIEVIVDNLLATILNEYDNICKCQRCINDIKAITLNNVKPCYVATEKGYTYAKINELEPQFKTTIISEITKSIDIVSNNPNH